jgi:DNA-binding helix-hairpin-helix protein with protein kinase domain
MNTFKEDQAAALAAAPREANLATYRAWLTRHPEVRDCIANTKMFEEYMDFTDELTSADFDFALGNLGSRLVIQKVSTPEQAKKDLVDEICDLLRSPNSDGRGGRYSEVALANERKRLQTFSKDQLTARRDEIVEKQRLQKLSAGQIRQELQASRPTPQVKVLPAEITKERIRAMTSYEIRKLIRDFTATVVNDRLFGRN